MTTKALLTILLLSLPRIFWGMEYAPSFIGYMKSVENGGQVGRGKKGIWYPHQVLGIPHIGYGHKIQAGENFDKGLTDAQVEELLQRDLDTAERQCIKEVKEWRTLNVRQKEMLLDFVFNLGTMKGFPKLLKGITTGNETTIKLEYKRHAVIGGVKRELVGRNKAFAKFFEV